jgi:hypothetical protein
LVQLDKLLNSRASQLFAIVDYNTVAVLRTAWTRCGVAGIAMHMTANISRFNHFRKQLLAPWCYGHARQRLDPRSL